MLCHTLLPQFLIKVPPPLCVEGISLDKHLNIQPIASREFFFFFLQSHTNTPLQNRFVALSK